MTYFFLNEILYIVRSYGTTRSVIPYIHVLFFDPYINGNRIIEVIQNKMKQVSKSNRKIIEIDTS